MIGDDSITSVVRRRRSAPGSVPSFAQPATAAARVARAGRAARRTRRRRRRAACARRPASAAWRRLARRRRRPPSRVVFSTSTATLEQRARARRPIGARRGTDAVDRLAAAARSGRPAPDRAAELLDVSAPRSVNGNSCAPSRRQSRSGGEVDLAARPPRPTCTQRAPSTSSSSTGTKPPSGGAPRPCGAAPGGSARARSSRGVAARARRCTRCASPSAPTRRASANGRRHEHAELPAQLVLRAPTRGTDRARSPRRARRRRPRAARRTRVEPRSRHAPRPASFSSCSTRRPTSGSARSALKRGEASSVSRRSRSQPLFGK